ELGARCRGRLNVLGWCQRWGGNRDASVVHRQLLPLGICETYVSSRLMYATYVSKFISTLEINYLGASSPPANSGHSATSAPMRGSGSLRGPSRFLGRMVVKLPNRRRHEERFLPSTPSDRFRVNEPTFPGTRGNEQEAPVADLGRLSEKLKTRAKKLRLAPRRRSSVRAA